MHDEIAARCKQLRTTADDAANDLAALDVLVRRAERALDILSVWYCLDVGYPKALSPDNVANAAYAKAVREEGDAL